MVLFGKVFVALLLSLFLINNFSQAQKANQNSISNLKLERSKYKIEKIEKICINKSNYKPLLKNNMRDQGSLNWCYAYVAADLISHKIGKLVSAFDVASNFNHSFPHNLYKGFPSLLESKRGFGFIKSAINRIKKKGVCLEKDLTSSNFNFSYNRDLKDSMRAIEKLKINYDKRIGKISSSSSHFFIKDRKYKEKKIKEIQNDFKCKISRSRFHGEWKKVFNLNLSRMIDILYRAGPVNIINEAVKESCKGRRYNIKNIKVTKKSILFNRSNSLINAINKQIDEGNIIGISYHPSLILGSKLSSLARHASSVVARKFDKKSQSCKFLIRNSYGANCSNRISSDLECKKGNIWVSQKQLAKKLKSISYIE